MGRRRAWLPLDPEQVVVEFVRHGRNERAAAELKRQYDAAPFEQRQILRARLDQAVALFAEIKARNDRLFPNRR